MKYINAIRKAIGAVLGAAIGVHVDTITSWVNVDFPSEVDTSIAVILVFIGAYIAPKNVPTKSVESPEVA